MAPPATTTSGVGSIEVAATHPPETMPGHDRPTAYYDGACPLCAREIDFYRRQKGAEQVCWVDIGDIDSAIVAPDLSRSEALARFTVRDVDGSLVSGSEAFVRIWMCLPRFRWLAKLFEVHPFAWLLGQAYRLFLEVRPRLQALAARVETQGPRN